MSDLLLFTDKARKKAIEFCKDKEQYLKFGVRRGGCSGYMYDITFVKEPAEGDEVFDVEGAKILVPKDSVEFMKGSTIDFADGLMDTGFKVENPNVKRSCGCGHSIG